MFTACTLSDSRPNSNSTTLYMGIATTYVRYVTPIFCSVVSSTFRAGQISGEPLGRVISREAARDVIRPCQSAPRTTLLALAICNASLEHSVLDLQGLSRGIEIPSD
jgi:hypothetical protein